MKIVTDYLPVLRINVENLNGRTYTQQNVDDIIKQFNEKIEKFGTFFGELGHPTDGSMDVNLRNVTHSTSKLRQMGDVLQAKVILLETDKSKEVDIASLLPKLVLRPRGFGNITPDRRIENYRICAFDLIQKETDVFAGLI